jgi:hypothetical protein
MSDLLDPHKPPSSNAAGRATSVVTPARHVTAPPTDPNAVLAPRRPRAGLSFNAILWVVIMLIAIETFAPTPYKPTVLAGEAMKRFQAPVLEGFTERELNAEEQRLISQMLAERQADYGAWKGRCAMLGMLDRTAGAVCLQAAENFYRQAIREVELARERFLEN